MLLHAAGQHRADRVRADDGAQRRIAAHGGDVALGHHAPGVEQHHARREAQHFVELVAHVDDAEWRARRAAVRGRAALLRAAPGRARPAARRAAAAAAATAARGRARRVVARRPTAACGRRSSNAAECQQADDVVEADALRRTARHALRAVLEIAAAPTDAETAARPGTPRRCGGGARRARDAARCRTARRRRSARGRCPGASSPAISEIERRLAAARSAEQRGDAGRRRAEVRRRA